MTAASLIVGSTPRDTPVKDMTMNRNDPGQQEFRGLIGSAPQEHLAEVRSRSPQMYDAMVEGAFGGSLTHAELPRAAREIATVAMLAVVC